MIAIAPPIKYIPMAALAGLLIFVAWTMFERYHFANILKDGAWDDRIVLLACFGLTLLLHMTVGIERLSNLSTRYTHAVIDLDEVHFIDMTGLVALDSALTRTRAMNLKIALIAPEESVREQLHELAWISQPNSEVKVLKSRAAAVNWAHPGGEEKNEVVHLQSIPFFRSSRHG